MHNNDNNGHNNGGYRRRTSLPNPDSVQGTGGPGFPGTPEAAMGARNFLIEGENRLVETENSNADFALYPANQYNRAALIQVPPAIPIQQSFRVVKADYNSMANYQYVRAGADVVGALGRNDQDEQLGVQQGAPDTGVFVIPACAAPNLVLGFVIEWSAQLQTSAALTMTVETRRFTGKSWQSVDRKFTLRIDAGIAANGGIFAALFAQRMSADDSCGAYPSDDSSGPAVGYGGMQKAIVQPAWLKTKGTAAGPTDPEPVFYDVSAPGILADGAAPEIRVSVPPNIASGFGCLARYITAGSPQLSDVRQALLLASANPNANTNLQSQQA